MDEMVIVAAHKPYWMPDDSFYTPLLVGAEGRPSPGWRRDDEGEQISARNATFCELTGHYWMWKNATADMYGLCHYRRYFAQGLPFGDKKRRLLGREPARRLLDGVDAVLPKKRRYWIETNESQYLHAHHAQDLTLTREILVERGDARYVRAWDASMRRRSGHRFNMFLMRSDAFQAYSEWLFAVLFELERRLDLTGYSKKDRRVFGYVGERLLDVWVEANGARYRECRVVNLESQHWAHKIASFLHRKFRGKPC